MCLQSLIKKMGNPMTEDRNITGTFNNHLGLGTTYEQNAAGVNSWDTSISAQTKINAYYQKNGYQIPLKEVKPEVKDSFLYKLFYKIARAMNK
jgi:hypothetical protein